MVRAYEEFFAGYNEDPQSLLAKTFENISGYDELIVLKDIRLESHCEHHIVPIIGKAHIGYLPNERVVGISKLVRLVDIFLNECRFRGTHIPNRRYNPRNTKAKRSWCCYRGRPSMHDNPRRSQIGCEW